MTSEEFTDSGFEQKLSKYNGAIAQLYRLDALWQDTHRHSRSGKLKEWNWDLDRIWCELAADASQKKNDGDNKESDEEIFEGFHSKISEALKNKDFEELYHTLLKKEIFLRKLQNKQGKGAAYEESVDEYMEG